MKRIMYILGIAAICVGIFFFFRSNPQPKDDVTPTPCPTIFETHHISEQLAERLSIDADISCPERETYSSYILGELTLDREKGESIFFPGGSDISIAYKDEWGNAYKNGGYALHKENGEKFSKTQYSISFTNAQYEQNLEIEDLLSRYAESHPNDEGHDLAFMSREDAVALGSNTILACGIPFAPALDTCIGLEHDQIKDWQQELLSDKSSRYNTFGKAVILSGLSPEDDAYFLSFSFRYDDIPVLGVNAPNVVYADAVFPPPQGYAKMLITSSGIAHFELYPAYAVTGTKEVSTIIAPEEAIARVKENYDNVILSTDTKIVSVYLEYIPIETGGETVLRPYWCLSMTHKITGEDGKTYWSDYLTAERINAFTGEDLKYGG